MADPNRRSQAEGCGGMKKTFSTIFVLIVALYLPAHGQKNDEEAEFLRMCQYGTQAQQITIKAAAKVLKLDFEPGSFRELYKRMRMCQVFIFSDNVKMTDLSPFKVMKNISSLRIVNNSIEDLRPLAGLKTLEKLDIGVNRITDLAPLSGLENLKTLDVSINRNIKNIAVIANFKHLKVFAASINHINDISPLSGLNNLEYVRLSNNIITNLEPLKSFSKNRKKLHLALASNQISDIAPLAALVENLEELDLISNQIQDIRPLAGMKNLKRLMLNDNKIKDITPLTGLINLTTLSIGWNPIEDITPLKTLVNLEHFWTIGLRLKPGTPQNFDELKLLMEKEKLSDHESR